MRLVVGLTGGIGCGKSTVAHLFAELGASVIDTDVFSHTLTQVGQPGYQAIVQHFGPEMLLADSKLDRAKLRTRVFSDPVAKAQLESILHPLIQAEVIAALAQATGPYGVLVVPLLFETKHYLPLIQRSLVIDCSPEDQITRTMARSTLSQTEVEAIMAQQLSRAVRLQQADDVILNDQNPSALQTKIRALHQRYLSISRESIAKP